MLSLENVLEKDPPGFAEMAVRNACFCLDSLEDEVGGVDLAVRMRVGNSHRFAFVFEESIRD